MVAAPFSWRAATKRAPRPDHGVRQVEVAGADDTEDLGHAEVRERSPDGVVDLHRSTRASTRAGLPEPATMGSGAAMRTAPVAGSRATFCSCVKPVLAVAHQVGVARERRIEGVRGAGVGADRLRADADDGRLLGDPPGAHRRDAGRVRAGLVGVEERLLARPTGVPPGAVEQPSTIGERPVLLLPRPQVGDLEQEVGVLGGTSGHVDDDGRGDQPLHGHRGDVALVPPRHPVVGGVEVRAGVLAGGDVVPVPGRAALVVMADLLEGEALGLPELRRQLDDRCVARQRRGEVDDLDAPGRDGFHERAERGHLHSS